ncbi:MAG: hypothetical protein SF052_05555 [Bacteroidia bacterium]|nr:hypothetical protein [Bacteroidia bacterium]
MKLRYLIFFTLIFVLIHSGCESVDLSLVNQVKRFEPEWMNLSEKVSFIDRNLRITNQRYEKDLEEVNPFISDPGTAERTDLYGMRSQYRNMIAERDDIQKKFDESKTHFVTAVTEFNEWQNKLMKKRLDSDKARIQLQEYQRTYRELYKEIDTLQNELIRNINKHNSLLRQITSALKLYTNYDINYR